MSFEKCKLFFLSTGPSVEEQTEMARSSGRILASLQAEKVSRFKYFSYCFFMGVV